MCRSMREPGAFLLAVRFHLFLAGVLTLHIVLLVGLVLSRARHVRPLGRLAGMLVGLVVVQLAARRGHLDREVCGAGLGERLDFQQPSVAIRDGGWLQTHIITAHVATGSLMLGTSVALALYAHRLLSGAAAARHASARRDWRRPYESDHDYLWCLARRRRRARSGWLARVADYVELTKPRIVVLELVTVVVAAHLASPWGIRAAGAVAHGARRGARRRQCRRVQSMVGAIDRRADDSHGRSPAAGRPADGAASDCVRHA